MSTLIVDPSVLVVIVLGTCLACIWMVYFSVAASRHLPTFATR